MKPHKWAKEIKAWADGFTVQYRHIVGDDWTPWFDVPNDYNPHWNAGLHEYRIKPVPKVDVRYATMSLHAIDKDCRPIITRKRADCDNLKLTFVDEKLRSAEVIEPIQLLSHQK